MTYEVFDGDPSEGDGNRWYAKDMADAPNPEDFETATELLTAVLDWAECEAHETDVIYATVYRLDGTAITGRREI